MRKTFIFLAILGILSLSCALPMQITFNPPTAQTEVDLALTITAQALTLSGVSTESAQETNTPLAPTAENSTSQSTPTPSSAPAAQQSPTTSFTPTSSTAMASSVSLDTNCRKGPGQAYDIVGALLVGETAEVVEKNTSSNYWIINNPDQPTSTCWLWGKYATVTGDISGLSEAQIPATPTPTATKVVLQPPAAPSNLKESSICYKQGQIHIYDGTFTWKDNSNNEDGFRIYYRDDGIPNAADVLAGTLGPNVTSFQFQIGHFKSGQTVLKVEAFNRAGASSRPSVLLNIGNCP